MHSQSFVHAYYIGPGAHTHPFIQQPNRQPYQTTTTMIIPVEILDRIIDDLYDDRKALLSLGLVCYQTLLRSRHHLFSTLDLGDNDIRFGKFLALVDVPWTSFTLAVKRIRLQGLFNSRHSKRLHADCDISRISGNLRCVESVWLMPSYAWCIGWQCIPTHVLELISRLHLRDLQLYSINFEGPEHVVDLFSRLQRASAVENLVLYNLRGEETLKGLDDSSLFSRHFRFALLDSCSLQLWQHIWEPLITKKELDVKVETLYLRSLSRSEEHQIPSLSKFLSFAGPSIQRLRFDIADLFNVIEEKWHYLDMIDLSQCVNVHALSIGIILLDECARRSRMMFQTLWRLLSAIPSPDRMREISISFRPTDFAYPIGTEAKDLAAFQWLGLVDRLRAMFRSLEKIEFLIGAREFEKSGSYMDALRQGGRLGALEKQGLVQLNVFPMPIDERMVGLNAVTPGNFHFICRVVD